MIRRTLRRLALAAFVASAILVMTGAGILAMIVLDPAWPS